MRFGGLIAVDDLSFEACRGEITAIIGPNGAGKTTVFNCLTGFCRPSGGSIRLNGAGGRVHLNGLGRHRIAGEAKVARTFQNIRLFPTMTVLENLFVAQHAEITRAASLLAGLLNLSRYRAARARALDTARDWLDRVGLLDQADTPAGSLPYGAQRRLEIARAMCTRPRLLCLDEPAAGLNPRESAELNNLLNTIRENHDLGVLLIEHDMSVVMHVSHRIVVLDHGVKIAEGTPQAIRNDARVIKAYLGEDDLADDGRGRGHAA